MNGFTALATILPCELHIAVSHQKSTCQPFLSIWSLNHEQITAIFFTGGAAVRRDEAPRLVAAHTAHGRAATAAAALAVATVVGRRAVGEQSAELRRAMSVAS